MILMDTEDIQYGKGLKRKRVIRIDGDLFKRLVRVTKKNNMTITAGAETGIGFFVDKLDYNYDSLLDELNKQPILRLNRNLFSKIFKYADRETIKAVIDILRRGVVDFYKGHFDELDKTIKEINKSSCDFAVPIMRINLKGESTQEEDKKIDYFFNKLEKLKCKNNGQFLPDNNLEDSEDGNFLIFVLKKEEEKKEIGEEKKE